MSAPPDDRERAHSPDQRNAPARRQGRRKPWRAARRPRIAAGVPRRADRQPAAHPARSAGRLRSRHGISRSSARGRPLVTRRRSTTTCASSEWRSRRVIPRRQLEAIGYLGVVPSPRRDDLLVRRRRGRPSSWSERAAAHDDWSEFQTQTDLVLVPAACYPSIPRSLRAAPLPDGGVSVDLGGRYVFRNEPSPDPARMQMFHQRELVRFGAARCRSPTGATRGVTAALELLRGRSVSTPRSDVASDPFFGRSGRMLARSQRSQALKFEIGVPIGGDEPTAVASFNCHREHFSSGSTASSQVGRRARLTRRASGSGSSASRSRCSVRARLRSGRLAAERFARSSWPERRSDRRGSACFGVDPATLRSHALHDRRSCLSGDELLRRHPDRAACTPAATSRSRHARAARSAPISRATSGRSSSRTPQDLEAPVRDRHPRDAAVPRLCRIRSPSSFARANGDRGARLVVPAGHAVDRVSARAREELGGDRRRSTSVRTAALLSQHRSVRAQRRRLRRCAARQARRPSAGLRCRRTPRSCASTPGAGSTATSCEPRRCGTRGPLRATPDRESVRRASPTRSARRSSAAARTGATPTITPTRSRPCAWPARRSSCARARRRGSSAATVPLPSRHSRASSRAPRLCRSSSRGGERSTRSRRWPSWPMLGTRRLRPSAVSLADASRRCA